MAGKAPTSTSTSTAIPTSISTKPISFADIVKKGSTATGGILPHTKTPQKPSSLSYKDRRLILNEATEIEEKIDPLKLRNQINKAFQEKKNIAIPIIATVSKSIAGTSIVLTTTEQFSAEFLTQNKTI
jgi:hypothetical protein